MKTALRRAGSAWLLGMLATSVWLLMTPITELGAAGALSGFFAPRGSSNDALLRMWRLQLPGTALACCLFSFFTLRLVRAGRPNWGRGGAYGAALGGTAALMLFASPLPGAATFIWGATFYLTGIPVVLVAQALPESIFAHLPLPSFSGLLHFWPIVVTTVLASALILVGGWTGQLALISCGRRLQNNQMQLTAPG